MINETFSFTVRTDNTVFYAILFNPELMNYEDIETDIKRPFKLLRHPSDFQSCLGDILDSAQPVPMKYMNDILDLCEEKELPLLENNCEYCLRLYAKKLKSEKNINSIGTTDLNLNNAEIVFEHYFYFNNSFDGEGKPYFIERLYDNVRDHNLGYRYPIESYKILNYLDSGYQNNNLNLY